MFSNVQGLSEKEAIERLKKYGPNILPERRPPSDFAIFMSQLKNPLVFVLVFAALISITMSHVADTLVIGLAVVINTFLGFFQEKQAGKAILALTKLITFYAEVIRDGKRKKIEASKVTVGDLVIVSQGGKIPADGSLVSANRLFIDESVLTGESVPVERRAGQSVFMGTTVLSGQALIEVGKVGIATEVGKIALTITEITHVTPLAVQLLKFSRQILVLVLSLTFIVFLVGLLFGEKLFDIFQTAVALAVSAIPEGLIVALTVVLAIGMRRMAKRKGLVKNLTSAETLGGVSVICVDKTGTLTLGQMKVTDSVGNTGDLATQMVLANDLDDPLVIAGYDWAIRQSTGQAKNALKKSARLDSIPFSSKTRYFASLNPGGKSKNILYINGAPDILLNHSTLSAKEKSKVHDFIVESTSEGKRLMGLARKTVSADYKRIDEKDLESGFEWVGILAFTDPIRVGVKESLQKAKKAGLRIIVITGDYAGTATAVMQNLGIELSENEIVTGEQLTKMDPDSKVFEKVRLFARTTPEQKLKIVEALKKKGEVVAMMGDGVNDAPALSKADIGIVVGNATDVAKESADLILIDSDFETVIAAIEEGRGIFDNLRKIILYLLSDAFQEIVAVLGALILRVPIPVSASQILWINVVSDGFPSASLSLDPKRKGIMNEAPRKISEHLVAPWMRVIMLIVSLVGGIVSLSLFVYYLNVTSDIVFARSVAFASLGINSLIYVFSIRTLMLPVWKDNPFKNKWLNIAVIAGFLLQFLPFATSTTRHFWGIKPLGINIWLIVFSASLGVFVIIEILKVLFQFRKNYLS